MCIVFVNIFWSICLSASKMPNITEKGLNTINQLHVLYFTVLQSQTLYSGQLEFVMHIIIVSYMQSMFANILREVRIRKQSNSQIRISKQ